jgi:Tannase and feruloyl esterase
MAKFSDDIKISHIASAMGIFVCVASLAGCGSDNDDSPPDQTAAQTTLSCDDSIKSNFKPDANTTVLLVKAFKKGDALLLSGTVTPTTPVAANDVCMVKLNVGPGNPGPVGAPSTSPGIGIEVWLPTQANWNNRIHVRGNGGWSGTAESSLTQISGTDASSVATVEGAVSATTDNGHIAAQSLIDMGIPWTDASFAMNPDGTINTALWRDFSERSLHELAVKTKALTKAYYGRDARYAYFEGASTGGRQGLKLAQAYPEDFDGILAGYPAINWTKFITAELYPQIVQQRDLGGVNLSAAQQNLMSNAAISACGTVGGVNLGYIPDPSQCSYDPRRDASVLCSGQTGLGVTGTNASASCVNLIQATAMNKIWYGQTPDGSVPDPALDNGFGVNPAPNQRWYGIARGTTSLGLAGNEQFPIASEMVALELQNARLASTLFRNATGNGANQWKSLSYADLSNAWDRGIALQPQFSNINTDNPDLSAFRSRNAKMLMYHGLSDELIPAQGSINYYNRVAAQMGGIPSVQNFYRFYLVPGMGHGMYNGTSNPNANPPLPTREQLYSALTDWVEKGTAPGALTVTAAATATTSAKTRPICVYPLKATYTSGNPNQVSSYTCS